MNLNDYKNLIRGRMGEHRFIHSVNVAKQAKKLAYLYGCDEKIAEIAGILHDVTKETPYEEQLKLIQEGGIILDDVEFSSKKLWHQASGMAYVRDRLQIRDNDVLNSIRYHTTGRAGMSLLEKIIFIADYIGEDRNYHGVDNMREKASKSLEEAMLFGLQFTIRDLSERMNVIHPNALACYNELILKDEKYGC